MENLLRDITCPIGTRALNFNGLLTWPIPVSLAVDPPE